MIGNKIKNLEQSFYYGLILAQAGQTSDPKGVNSGLLEKVGKLFPGVPGPGGSASGARNAGELIIIIINILLIVAASIAVIFLIYGGYQYVTSRGNEEALEGAKRTIGSSVLGLVIIILAFVVIRIITAILIEGEVGIP